MSTPANTLAHPPRPLKSLPVHEHRLLLVARWFALIIALIAVPVGARLNGPPVDFAQLYMGGLMVRTGHWESLYPIPRTQSEMNAGYPEGSQQRPDYQRAAERQGIGDTFRFIHAPPVALLLAPLSLLPFQSAQTLWTMLMALCVGGTAISAGLIVRELHAISTMEQSAIVVFAALLPRALFSSSIGNVSPLVGLCIGMSMLAMLQRHPRRTSLFLTVGSFAKYAPALLLLLLLARRSWAAIAWVLGTVATLCLLTILCGGLESFKVFFRDIWPTLQRPVFSWTSQTVWGVSAELWGGTATFGAVCLALGGLKIASFLLIVALVFARARRSALSNPDAVASAVLLLCWLLLFGPITWAHYAVYFAPFLGWLYLVCRARFVRTAVGCVAVLLIFVPWKSVPLPGPLSQLLTHFSLFLGITILGAMAAYVLMSGDRQNPGAA